MKICYVISTIEAAGGANRSLLDMIDSVRKVGYECVVLGPAYGSMAEEVKKHDIRYKVISFKSSVKAENTVKNIAKYAYNEWTKVKIKRFFKDERIDLVHNNSFSTLVGMEAAYSLGIPYICHIRENIWSGLGMEFIKDSEARKMIKNAGVNIAISEFIQNEYRKFEPDGKYVVIRDGIRTDNYYDHKEIFDGQTIHIGMIGVINPQKGQEEAVKAIEILSNRGYDQIRLEIIGKDGMWRGDRSYAFNLKKYVEEKRLTCVTFLPPIEDINELKAKRYEHDINLICSRAEGLGRTTVESMLSGSLTIAANAGATCEIMKHLEHGLLYKCGNPEDLADTIEYAIKNKDLMRTITKKGQTYAADRYSIEKYASSILDLYEQVMGTKKEN